MGIDALRVVKVLYNVKIGLHVQSNFVEARKAWRDFHYCTLDIFGKYCSFTFATSK